MLINDTDVKTSNEKVIDLTNIPIKPIGKKEIQQLEVSLIIATLYSPEIIELIRDPVERSTWVDSLAVAAAALAREIAGYTVTQIAEEVGRSETTIRAHLTGRTKAGKLVRNTFDRLKSGQLKLVIPFIKTRDEMIISRPDYESIIRDLKTRYENEINELRKKIETLEKTINELKTELAVRDKIINSVREKISTLRELISIFEKS